MKVSQYVYIVEKANKVICFSTLHNTFVMISPMAYNMLCNSVDNLKKDFPRVYAYLVENKMLIDDEVEELDIIRYRNKVDTFYNRNFNLTLLPSLDCNLRCWYCYEDHIRNSRMGKDVQKSIILLVKNKIHNKEIDSLSLDFYGGEPLLDFYDIAYPVSKSLKSLCEESNIPFTTFFTTNGSLIDDDIIDKLAELNPSFQITLDGYKEKHNKIRFRKSNQEGTYQHIIDTIYKITNRIENTFVNIRINYDEQTLQNIDELLNDLSGVNRAKVNVHLERVWQTKTIPHNEVLKNALYLFMANGFKTTYLNWHPRGCTCKAERLNQAVISYDGKVYKCTGRNFTDTHCDGILDNTGTIQWKEGRVERRISQATFENLMCMKCKMLPLCMGPCSQKQIDVGSEHLHQVCTKNVLEMQINDYIEYICNNMLISNQMIK